MMRYSVQHRDQIFAKGYGFLSFAKNIVKNISINLSSRYSQQRLNQLKNLPQIYLKLLQKE